MNGLKITLRAGTTDRMIVNEVFMYEDYNPSWLRIKPDFTIVDVGGHIGVFTCYSAKKAYKGKVFVFEPLKENFEILKKNISQNNFHNVKIYNSALSNKNGKDILFVSDSDNKGSNSFYIKKGNSEKLSVNKISLKDFIKNEKLKEIDLLKLDCEGGEYDILFKAGKNIKKIKAITMEYHNIDKERTGDKIKSFLEKEGFMVKIKKLSSKRGMLYALSKKDNQK